ncbi:hypothetical protein ACFQ0B_30930 [Nonomuraea thailandensis]
MTSGWPAWAAATGTSRWAGMRPRISRKTDPITASGVADGVDRSLGDRRRSRCQPPRPAIAVRVASGQPGSAGSMW